MTTLEVNIPFKQEAMTADAEVIVPDAARADADRLEVVRQAAYEAGLREAEARWRPRREAIEAAPEWLSRIEAMIDGLQSQNPGMDRREAEKQILDSHLFQPWQLEPERIIDDVPEAILTGLPQSELIGGEGWNGPKITYRRPAEMAGFATPTHAEKRKRLHGELPNADNRRRKEIEQELGERDLLFRQYDILYRQAQAQQRYWAVLGNLAADVLAWKEQTLTKGKKAKPPKWLLAEVKEAERQREAWEAGMQPPKAHDPDMFARAETPKPTKRKPSMDYWTSPGGSVNTGSVAAWWKKLTKSQRAEEFAATEAHRPGKERDEALQTLRILDERYPLPEEYNE